MIKVDGSVGGGQVLRVALGLSALTGQAFEMENIRVNRPKPGLKVQHLECVKAVKKLCNADVEGASLGSRKVKFIPGRLEKNKVKVRISTAGSVGLVLQSLLIPAVDKKLEILIEGGATYGLWAPPMDTLENVVFQLYSKMGYAVRVVERKDGFFPKGGAYLKVVSEKAELEPLKLLSLGKVLSLGGVSIASEDLRKRDVAERQAKAVTMKLFDRFKINPKINKKYVQTLSTGSGLSLWIKTAESVIGSDSIGETKRSSEQVASGAVEKLIKEYDAGAAVDTHAADHLMPYMALAGSSEIKVAEITEHMLSNKEIIERFLDVKFKLKNNLIKV